MAEVTGLRNNALPYPVYGAPYGITFPIFDADGDLVTGAAGLDSEVSKNGDTFADCTNEATEIATSSGMYYLLLTATEMTADVVTIIVKTSTSGAKTTPITLYPRKLVALATGTSQGGAVGYITLAASTVLLDDQFNGCLCVAVLDTAAEARILQDCTASNQQCTVTPEWNTTPDSDDTYTIYLPEGMQLPTVNVKAVSDDTTAADNAELMFDGTGYAGGTARLAVNAAQISGDATAADTLELFAEALDQSTGQLDAGSFATGVIASAADVADAVCDEALSGHSTAGTVGKAITDVLDDTGTSGVVLANDAITAAKIAADAIGASELAADAATEIANAIAAKVVESQGNYTVQQVLSILLAACAGVTADSGATLKSPNGTATRIAATIDGSNNRTAMTLTPSA